MADDDRIVIEGRLTSMETKLDSYLERQEQLIDDRLKELEARITKLENKFMFLVAAVALGSPALSAGALKLLGVAPDVAAALPTP